jgi:predicted Rossmann fold nucleotide-binding protein DprA/Smf involved in DNA uptake
VTPSPHSTALLLLCSSLAIPDDPGAALKPLGQRDWSLFSALVVKAGLPGPAQLLEDPDGRLCDRHFPPPLAGRLRALLDRRARLGAELDRLAGLGIRAVTLADPDYPSRLQERLGERAPRVLFLAGDPALLEGEALAVVGSRDVDEPGARFAGRLGRLAAGEGLTVVSGGAKGADLQAMTAAVTAGGAAAGVLADSLERSVAAGGIWELLEAGHLALLTPFHPRATFTVGGAMHRNKLIYALARWGVVVSCRAGSGGTWAGAVENLKHGWAPLFVRSGPDAPAGNRELVARGALPLPDRSAADGELVRLLRSM